MISSTSHRLEKAKHYAALGYSVFPCKFDGKKPITVSGHKDASTDLEKIDDWWRKSPELNVAIATHGLFVLDIDGADNQWQGELDEDQRAELEAAPTALSPRGGRHHYFRQPDGSHWRCKTDVFKHVDIRADGGYIVAPPSQFEGKPYQWREGSELRDSLNDLPVLPDWLKRKVNKGLEKKTFQPAITGPIPEGQRNSSLFQIASNLATGCAGLEELETELQKINQDRCKPPLDSVEVAKIAANAYSRERTPAGGATKHANRPNKAERFNAVFERADKIKEEPLVWLWPQRISLGRATILQADPGDGKSLLTIDLAARLSKGKDWPDGSKGTKGRTLIINTEDRAEDTIKPRLVAAGGDLPMVHIFRDMKIEPIGDEDAEPMTVMLDLTKHLKAIEEELKTHSDTKLLVIDPAIQYAGDTKGNDYQSVYKLLAPLNSLAAKHMIAVIAVMHLNKNNLNEAKQRSMGSMGWLASVRSAWHISRDPYTDDGAARILSSVKQNNAEDGSGLRFFIRSDERDQPFLDWDQNPVTENADQVLADLHQKRQVKLSPKRQSKNSDIANDDESKFLKELLADGPKLVTEVKQECNEAGMSWEAIKRRKKALGITGYKEKKVKGKWKWKLDEDRTETEGRVSPTEPLPLLPLKKPREKVKGSGSVGDTDCNAPF